jgi:hypothetical protein
MTKSERKVEVCREVMRYIRAGVLNDKTVMSCNVYLDSGVGNYGIIDRLDETPMSRADAKALLESKKCEMCARGALMLAKVAKHNGGVRKISSCGIDQSYTSRSLKDAFTDGELNRIERAFETLYRKPADRYIFTTPERKFGCQFKSDADRLMAICQNIIDHKGQFRPDVEYEIVKE